MGTLFSPSPSRITSRKDFTLESMKGLPVLFGCGFLEDALISAGVFSARAFLGVFVLDGVGLSPGLIAGYGSARVTL